MSTGISWCDEVWNPVTGCSKVSAGCKHCYAAALAPRLAAMGKKGYTDLPWTAQNASENVTLHEDRLQKPLHWRKARRVFVNSMSDLFHEQVSDEFIDRVFAVMALAKHHTFQILTKRPERISEYASDSEVRMRIGSYMTMQTLFDLPEVMMPRIDGGQLSIWKSDGVPWPLANVWLGTSVEDQWAADERIPHLLRTPATVRFLSCEPLLGPVSLTAMVPKSRPDSRIDCLRGDAYDADSGEIYAAAPGAIDWVIAGGESGPKHRPMDKDWARSLRDQCKDVGIPFFYKQSSGVRNEMDPFLDGAMHREMPRSFRGRGVAV